VFPDCSTPKNKLGAVRHIPNGRDTLNAWILLATVGLGGFPQTPVDSENDVTAVTILLNRCVNCHGPEKQKNGLRLDERDKALLGGDSGKAIDIEHPDQSSILKHIQSKGSDRMPPKGESLSPSDIQSIRTWISKGAKWPILRRSNQQRETKSNDHWAWQPLKKYQAVTTDEASRSLDNFWKNQLLQKGWAPSREANRRTLIRRLSFDLHGMPPDPGDIETFIHDKNPAAWANLVEKYLASPRYGERWARHWLDIIHYADTHGFERDQKRENAWRYRDWVIRALNSDMPYDQFLRYQIAGDVFRPNDPDAIIATGFLAAGPWDFVGQAETPSPLIKRLARADDLDDMTTQVMAASCAMTVNCARCHDHKLDPISQAEYYSLWSVFSGVKRGNREIDPREVELLASEKAKRQLDLTSAKRQLAQMGDKGLDLADIVGGGNGTGNGNKGNGLGIVSGKPQKNKTDRIVAGSENRPIALPGPYLKSLVIPSGGKSGEVPLTNDGLIAHGIPKTSGEAWDAVRNGPVNAQKATNIGLVDFGAPGHSLLGLHANAAITFDLAGFRNTISSDLKFQTVIGYGGRPEGKASADVRVLIDGQPAFHFENISSETGHIAINIPLGTTTKFLTLMATEGSDGNIGFDQVYFGDPRIVDANPRKNSDKELAQIVKLKAEVESLERQLQTITFPKLVYAVVPGQPEPIRILLRGNPEQPGAPVNPGALKLVQNLDPNLGTSEMAEGQRRLALANWITHPENPLPPRVMVNRIWQHHFGIGLVETPSDFGLGGSKPSNPELLDWLASEFKASGLSVKSMHRIILNSKVYKQDSQNNNPKAASADSSNRFLWRQNPRRLDGESVRDSILSVSGTLNPEMYGPGYQDFEYKEEYAPVYRYVYREDPVTWKRSIYRFVVRTTPEPLLTALDCPNPANLSPIRNITTTANQALALLNGDFVTAQSRHFAKRLGTPTSSNRDEQVRKGFLLAFGRAPSDREQIASRLLIEKVGLNEFCRMLINSNEFIYVD